MRDIKSTMDEPVSNRDQLWWTNPFDPESSLGSQIREVGKKYAGRPAVLVDHEQWLTHGDIHQHARGLEGVMRSALDAHRCPVVCLVSTNASLYIALVLLTGLGADFSMLDPASPPKRNASAVDSIGAKIVLVDSLTIGVGRSLAGESGQLICLDDATNRVEESLDLENDQCKASDVAVDDGRMFIFTSGSTGQPKGVVRSYSSMLHTQYNLSKRCQYESEDIMFYTGSPGHVGTINDALSVLLNGHASVPFSLEGIDIGILWRMFIKHNITKAALPPSLLRVFLNYGMEHKAASSLRCMVGSGEALLRSDVELFFKVFDDSVTLWQSYGSTECGHMCWGSYSNADSQGTGPLELSMITDGVNVEVLDEEGNCVSSDEVGVIRVRTRSLADGYTQESHESKNGFGEDSKGRYFFTGDRARMLDGKKMIILGREDRQVNIHGRRLELSEVESAIMSLDEWGEASVVVVEDQSASRHITAMVCSKTHAEENVVKLRRDLESLLPQSAIPKFIIAAESLPKTTAGKVDLEAVTKIMHDQYKESRTRETSKADAPVGSIENWIADAWQEVLKSEGRPGREIDFDVFGGDSLDAISLCLVMGQQFGIDFDVDFITANSTIRSQAHSLQGSEVQIAQSRFVTLHRSDEGPVVFLFPGSGGHAWVYRSFARELHDQSCTLVAINYLISQDADHHDLKPDNMAEEVLAFLQEAQLGHRPVVFAGFSLGSLVCSSVAESIRTRCDENRVQCLLLLDPSPLSSSVGIKQRISRMRSKVRNVQKRAQKESRRERAQRRLDIEILRTTRALKSNYQPDSTVTRNHKCYALLTGQGKNEASSNGELFDQRVDDSNVEIIEDLQHLDLLRQRGVGRCAEWVWSKIESLR
jgi:L-serine---[L-seryl-carrier protein] ligase